MEKRIKMNVPEKFMLKNVIQLPDKYSNFLSGKDENRVKIKQFFKEDEKTFIMWFCPGESAMGPPGYCHGGLISTILDESMGSCCWWNGYMVMTAKIEIRYKLRLPINSEYISSSMIKLIKGKRILAEAEITDRDSKLYALSKGTFLKIAPEKLENIPGYSEQIKKATGFVNLRQKGLSIKDTLKLFQ